MPGYGDDLPASLGEALGDSQTDTGACAGDDDDWHDDPVGFQSGMTIEIFVTIMGAETTRRPGEGCGQPRAHFRIEARRYGVTALSNRAKEAGRGALAPMPMKSRLAESRYGRGIMT